jgi:hypothetical protein
VERLYRAIDDRRRDDGRGGGQSQRGSGRAATGRRPARGRAPAGRRPPPTARALRVRGADLLPGARRRRPSRQAEPAREWSERLLRAHAGDGEFSMLRTLMADLPRTRTPWEQVLRTQLARGLSQRPALSWSRPSRSYIANQGRCGRTALPFEPGVHAVAKVPRLVVVVDVSGSIDDDLLQRFAREIEAITRRLEAG